MTQVVVARYLDLPQVQVAASALRSAGLHPVLFDEQQCSVRWTTMFGWGGCRLAVPGEELEDALAILGHPQADSNPEPPIPLRGWISRLLAGVFGILLLMPEAGWLVLGVRDRRNEIGEIMMGMALAMVVTGVIGALVWELGAVISGLLLAPDTHSCIGCT